jgi:hypothetical protein
MSDVREGPMRILTRCDCRKQVGKIVLAPTAKAGNGTVTVAALPLKDTEYYQVDKHGDYTQG